MPVEAWNVYESGAFCRPANQKVEMVPYDNARPIKDQWCHLYVQV